MSERIPSLEDYLAWYLRQTPEMKAVIAQQIQVDLIAEEAVATSAIEGVKINKNTAKIAAHRKLQRGGK